MDNLPSLVLKVRYEDMLRRFSVPLNLIGQLDLDMAGLRAKIVHLFNLPADAELTLTYIDEDGDVVSLVDDNDLQDIMKQSLKFLKINVQLKGKTPAVSPSSSNGGSTQPAQDPSKNINKCLSDILMVVPEPLRDTISRLSMDLASKAVFTGPVVAEILDCVSKLGLQASRPQESGSSASTQVPESTSVDPIPTKVESQCKGPSGDASKDAGKKTSGLGAGSSVECLFSGIPVNNDSRMPLYVPPRMCHSKKSQKSDYWTTMGMFHKGIRCDGCGVLPITGPRFKSKVKEDYDLCSICFSKMGDEKEYLRMDRPVQARLGRPFKGIFGPGQNPFSLHQSSPPCPPGRLSKPKLDSRFIVDVNVLDGTVMAPSTPFTKIWCMRNNGSLVWPRGTQLVWIGGDRLSDSVSVEIEIPEGGVPIDGELNVAVDFSAPESPGRYISYWRMATSSGVKFGQRVWVLIHVDPSLKESVWSAFQGLDLNASPDPRNSRGFEGIDLNCHSGHSQGSNVFPKAVNPKCDAIPKIDESNIPKKGDLIFGNFPVIVPPSAPQAPSSSVSQPIIDLTETGPVGTSAEASLVKDVPVSSEGDKGSDDIEQVLLRELEEMGFKQIDLNKEVLRKNEYNFEQSVDALCEVDDWDPILDELQEMGFCDEETNKRLLKKNNGSIKRVVMDLLTGEKA